MLFALSDLQLRLEAYGIPIVILVIVIGGAILALKFTRGTSTDYWSSFYGKALKNVTKDESGPLVEICFHTYAGFLVVFSQTEHKVVLPAQQALALLRSLHRYNLLRCLVPYPGILFVPLLSYSEYLAQQRRVQAAIRNHTG